MLHVTARFCCSVLPSISWRGWQSVGRERLFGSLVTSKWGSVGKGDWLSTICSQVCCIHPPLQWIGMNWMCFLLQGQLDSSFSTMVNYHLGESAVYLSPPAFKWWRIENHDRPRKCHDLWLQLFPSYSPILSEKTYTGGIYWYWYLWLWIYHISSNWWLRFTNLGICSPFIQLGFYRLDTNMNLPNNHLFT